MILHFLILAGYFMSREHSGSSPGDGRYYKIIDDRQLVIVSSIALIARRRRQAPPARLCRTTRAAQPPATSERDISPVIAPAVARRVAAATLIGSSNSRASSAGLSARHRSMHVLRRPAIRPCAVDFDGVHSEGRPVENSTGVAGIIAIKSSWPAG